MASITDEDDNFFKIFRLVTNVGTHAIRVHFDILFPPVKLKGYLAQSEELLKKNSPHILSDVQWKILFPPTVKTVSSRDFDITLMACVISSIPSKHLSNKKKRKALKEIKTIKKFRNNLVHSENNKIKQTDFIKSWTELSDAILRLGGSDLQTECNAIKDLKIISREELDTLYRQITFLQKKLKQSFKKRTDDFEQLKRNQTKSPDWMIVQLQHWKKDEAYFVETTASKHVMSCLQHNICVSVVGPPGVGKTFLVHHVALEMEKIGFNVVSVKTPYDVKHNYKLGKKMLFVVDDMCGNFTANASSLYKWQQEMKDVTNILKDGLCKLLLTCRLQVFKDEGFKHSDMKLFETCVCNLIDKEIVLTNSEKENMSRQYVMQTHINKLKRLYKYECFPLLCKLYSTNKNKSNFNLKRFLTDPFYIFKNELDNLYVGDEKSKSKYKFSALLLLVVCNNHIEKKRLEGKDDHLEAIVTTIQDKCGIHKKITGKSLIKVLNTLTGSYLKDLDENGVYRAIHDKLFDYLAYYFGTENKLTKNEFTELLIQHADKDFILERFVIKQQDQLDDREIQDNGILLQGENVLRKYIKRVFYEMTKSHEIGKDLCYNRHRNNKMFQKELQSFIMQLDNDEIVKLLEEASSDFVLGMFVMNLNQIRLRSAHENDYLHLRIAAYFDLQRPAYNDYTYCGILLDNDHLILKYIERIFVDMNSSDDVRNYIVQCRNSENDTFRLKLLNCMKNCSPVKIRKLIQNASNSFVQVMFVITVDDINQKSLRAYMHYGIEIPSEVVSDYINRVFDDITKSKDVNKYIKRNRNRKNTVFQTKLQDCMEQLGGSEIENLIKFSSQDFVCRLCVMTVDSIKERYDCEFERYGVVIPADYTQMYIARVLEGLEISNDTENYIKYNRNRQTERFKIALRTFVEQLKEDEIRKLIQTSSSDFLHKWFITKSEDILIGSMKEYEQYGIILTEKNLQMYNERILTLMKRDTNFVRDMKFNRNTASLYKYIRQLPVSQFTELIKAANIETFHQMIIVDVQNELEEESSNDVGKNIWKVKDGCIQCPDSLIKQYMDKMVSDWSTGYLYAVIENINMKNRSFVQKFLDHLNHLEPFEISDLINGKEQKTPIFNTFTWYGECSMKALTVCCIHCDANLAKWCAECHCFGNRNKKHYKMCALFLLIVFDNELKEQALIDDEPRVKDMISLFERNHDIGHAHENIQARLLRDELDSSLQGIVVKRNGAYHILNNGLFTYLFIFFGSIEHLSAILIEYADLNDLYQIFLADKREVYRQFSIDLPATELQKCIERIVQSLSRSKQNIDSILSKKRMDKCYSRGNVKAIRTYNENLKKDKIEMLIKNSCIEFINKFCILDETKRDTELKRIPIILIPSDFIPMYMKIFFDDLTISECVEVCLNKNRNKNNKAFHTALSMLLKSIQRDDVKKLILEASSDFISQMLVISEDDIKDGSYWEHEKYGIVLPEDLIDMYIERVFDDVIKLNKVPENRNVENKTFRDIFHSYTSSISDYKLLKMIKTASSKCLSHMFLLTEGDLKDISSQRRECYFKFVSHEFHKLFKQKLKNEVKRMSHFFCTTVYRFSHETLSFTIHHSYKKDDVDVLLTVSFKNDKIIDNLHQHPTRKIFTNKNIKLSVRSSTLIVQETIKRMIQDWNDEKVHDVLGNINLSNASFRSQFISYLQNTDNEVQTKLAKTNDIVTGDSPLAVCCYVGISQLAEWCLKNNTNTNSINKYGETPLYIACYHIHSDLVWCLLNHEKKADVNKGTHVTKVTPLYLACEKGLITIASHLLKEEIDVNHLCKDKTPLFVACKYGHIDIVKLLLIQKEDKIDINKGKQRHYSTDETPLYIACKKGHKEIVSLLLNHTADEIDVNRKTFKGETPLYVACEGGYNDIVPLLLKHESSGLNKSRFDGATSLFVACQKGYDEVVSTLCHQTEIQIDKRMIFGMSPLFIASLLGHTKIVEILLKGNADCYKCVHDKETVKMLVNREKDRWGPMLNLERYITGLREKDNSFDLKLLKLKKQGMVEDRVSNLDFGSSPLHIGCALGHTEIVKLLVDTISDVNCLNEIGKTPLCLAKDLGHEDIVSILLSKGAKHTLERRARKRKWTPENN